MMAEAFDNVEAAELGISPDERARRQAIIDRRSEQGMKDKWAQNDRTAVKKAMENISPPAITQTRCKICMHTNRLWVEQMIVKGYAYLHISEQLLDEDGRPELDRRSIKNHAEKHMTLEEKRIRAELDEQIRTLGANEEAGAQGAFTDRGALKVLIRKAFEEAQAGLITMEIRDMIQAIKLLNDMEVKASDARAAENEEALRIFLQAVQTICDADTQGAIVEEVQRLRLRANIPREIEHALPALTTGEVDDGS